MPRPCPPGLVKGCSWRIRIGELAWCPEYCELDRRQLKELENRLDMYAILEAAREIKRRRAANFVPPIR